MHIHNVKVSDNLTATVQVSFAHTPYSSDESRRATEAQLSILLPVHFASELGVSNFAHVNKQGRKEYTVNGQVIVAVPVAKGVAICSERDQFARATGRTHAVGKAIAALHGNPKHAGKDTFITYPAWAKIKDYIGDLSDQFGKAVIKAVQ